MGLFDYIFKSKKKREQDARVKDALKRADDTIARIEAGLEKNEKRWRGMEKDYRFLILQQNRIRVRVV